MGEWESRTEGERESRRVGERERGREGERERGREGEWESGRRGRDSNPKTRRGLTTCSPEGSLLDNDVGRHEAGPSNHHDDTVDLDQ